MPRITRRHKKTSRKHVKKTKYTRRKRIGKKHRTRRRRGGMPPPSSGWMGPSVKPTDKPTDTKTTIGRLLFKNDAYVPNTSDYETVNLDDLSQAVRDLNAYFGEKLTDYNKRPVGITIENMAISNCTSLLRAGNPKDTCLNIEYVRTLGHEGRQFTNFRQIGPLDIFKHDDDATGNFELPFITILNLLDLRFDATKPITEADSRNPEHILSLLIKDMSEKEYEVFVPPPPEPDTDAEPDAAAAPAAAATQPAAAEPSTAAAPAAAERVGRFQVSKPYQ